MGVAHVPHHLIRDPKFLEKLVLLFSIVLVDPVPGNILHVVGLDELQIFLGRRQLRVDKFLPLRNQLRNNLIKFILS
mgnify:CR=1 FL=1